MTEGGGLPYTTSKGDFPVAEWGAVLYKNSAHDNQGPRVPLPRLFRGKTAEKSLQATVNYLRLAVGLWVIGGAHPK